MIKIRAKWRNILTVLLLQMLIINIVKMFIEIEKIIGLLSAFFGWVGIILLLAPVLNIYEYEENKERRKHLQKICNILTKLNMKNLSNDSCKIETKGR